MLTRIILVILLSVYSTGICFSQVKDKKLQHLFTLPKSYVAAFTSNPPSLDDDPDAGVWKNAKWSDLFVDIEGDLKPKPYYSTRVKMLWDKEYLYIAANLEDKHVWAYLDQRDQVVFYDNDFEVFIDPSNTTHQYFEYEVNALNTIFDLFLPKPYRTGTAALVSWDSNKLKTRVCINGSLNDPSDVDKGWTVRMAIPFADVTVGNDPLVPGDGDIWRINFSRVQWETEIIDGKYVKKKGLDGKNLPENNWVWSPQGVINMHLPERWGYIQFSKIEDGKNLPEFEFPYAEVQRQYLWLIYYKQMEHKDQYGHFATTLEQLDIDSMPIIDGRKNILSLESISNQFVAKINDKISKVLQINNEGYVKSE